MGQVNKEKPSACRLFHFISSHVISKGATIDAVRRSTGTATLRSGNRLLKLNKCGNDYYIDNTTD